jgi:hypothetical protein
MRRCLLHRGERGAADGADEERHQITLTAAGRTQMETPTALPESQPLPTILATSSVVVFIAAAAIAARDCAVSRIRAA